MAVSTAGALLAEVIKPPKQRKLIEVLETKGLLKDTPNVAVYPRRVTPIDKEKKVGRWKIIERELEKRQLPVTGTAGLSKSVESKWLGMKQ